MQGELMYNVSCILAKNKSHLNHKAHLANNNIFQNFIQCLVLMLCSDIK